MRLLLKPKDQQRDPLTRLLNLALGWFFKLFNRGFTKASDVYAAVVGMLLRVSVDRAGGLRRAART